MKEKTFEASANALITAAPQVIYDLLKDYHVGHPSILPPKYFKSLKVQAGGIGSGTVIAVDMEVMGKVYREELMLIAMKFA